jgi:hypothetical protein
MFASITKGPQRMDAVTGQSKLQADKGNRLFFVSTSQILEVGPWANVAPVDSGE